MSEHLDKAKAAAKSSDATWEEAATWAAIAQAEAAERQAAALERVAAAVEVFVPTPKPLDMPF